MAPFGETAAGLKADSARITPATKEEGREYLRAADSASSAGVGAAGFGAAGFADSWATTGATGWGVGSPTAGAGDSTVSMPVTRLAAISVTPSPEKMRM